ncbi:MAG: MBL fold metallo-hydrolase [Gammaproteobacteria bacterium]
MNIATVKLITLAVFATTFSLSHAAGITGSRYADGLEQVRDAQQALGGATRLHDSTGISLHGEGDYDLGVRMQGRFAGRSNIVPIMERLNFNPVTGATSYESNSFANADAAEHLRYVWDDDGRLLLLELINRRAFWISGGSLPGTKSRYASMVPDYLLQLALQNRQTLRSLGETRFAGKIANAVSFTLPSSETLTLYIARRTKLVLGAEYLLDMPQRGDTVVTWIYGKYQDVPGLGLYPIGYRIELDGELLKSIRYQEISAGINETYLTIPEDIVVPERPTTVATDTPEPQEPLLPEPRELAAGVYLVPNIRGGFHVLLVEFPEYLLVVDTPSGYFEMQQLPAMNWVEGETSSSVGRRLLAVAKKHFPEKPVRYAVLTHCHGDHSGGVRPFIAAGTTILATQHTAPEIEKTARNRFTLVPDELTGKSMPPILEIVDQRHVIKDGNQEVQLIELGNNPHSESMLAIWLPESKLLYVADLFEPIPMHVFPDPARVPAMKWFVNWLDNSGLEPETIVAIHGTAMVTTEHLDKIRQLADENR